MMRIGLGAALLAGLFVAAPGPASAADWAGHPGYHGYHHHWQHHHGRHHHWGGHGRHHLGSYRHHWWKHAYGPPVFLSCSDRPGHFASPVRPVDCDEAYVARGVVYNAPMPPVVRGVYAAETAVVRARY